MKWLHNKPLKSDMPDPNTDLLYNGFTRLMDYFESNHLPIVLLRPKKIGRIDCFEGDYDFLYSQDSFQEILSAIHGICKDEGIHFELNQKAMNKSVITLFVGQNSKKIVFEFWTNVEITDGSRQRSTQIPAASIFNSKLIQDNREALFCLIYITHLHHKNKDIKSDENVWRLELYSRSLEKKTDNLSSRCVDLLNGLKDDRINLFEANSMALSLLNKHGILQKNGGVVHVQNVQRKILKKYKYAIKRVIPMIGPDGSGKGTIQQNALAQKENGFYIYRFKELYRVFPLYNIRYRFFKNYRSITVTELDESMLHFIYWMSMLSLPILLLRRRAGIIVMDRYFTDYFASPIRCLTESKEIKLIRFYRFYLSLTPTPHKMIILGCKDETLILRKNELENEAVRKIEELSYDFVCRKRVPSVLFLSTENPPDQTARVLNAFLEY